MPVTLSTSLTAHQRGPRKRPALSASIAQTRFGVPIIRFAPSASVVADSAPVAAVTDGDGDLWRFRNDAGSLEIYDAQFGWSNIDTVTAAQGLAAAYDPVAGVVLLAYGDGNDLKLRTSADGFASATTLVTEASPIGSVALAVRASNGNACAFYTLGTTTTLKRLRRTSGSWAGSGTTWSKTGDVASLTGLAAVHSGNFYLAITGTEVTTTDEKLWIVAMGDGPIPSNAWSSFVTVAEADADASLSFAFPALAFVSGVLFCLFRQVEAGNVAEARLMLTSTTESGAPLAHWTEPYPPAQPTGDHGAALAFYAAAGLYMVTAADVYLAELLPTVDLSPRVLSCSWRETPTSCRVRIDLEEHRLTEDFDHVRPGCDLTLTHGFYSDPEGPTTPEDGIVLRVNVARVTRRFAPGKATVTIEADGPWESFARYRAPQAWTAPAGYTRGQVFARVAARAGVEISEASGDRAPSTAWSTDTPGFAVAAGERASTTLARLLEPTPDFTRIDGTGAVQICGGFTVDDEPADEDEQWARPRNDSDHHPLFTLTTVEEHETNWIRLTGPDRYADRFTIDSELYEDAYNRFPAWAHLDHVRDLSAETDDLAEAAAYHALLRRQWLTPWAELTAPVHVGIELFDIVNPQVEPIDDYYQLDPRRGRVISRGLEYKAGPAGPAAYNSVLTLGPTAYPSSAD